MAPVAPVLIIGLLIRYLLAPFTSWPHDDVVWFQATAAGQHQLGLYTLAEFAYPPVWGVMLETLGQAISHLGVVGSAMAKPNATFAALPPSTYAGVITTPVFNLWFKSLLFAFDLGCGLILRSMVTSVTGNQRAGKLAFALWFLNPFVIFETAVVGTFDVVVGFLMLASVALVLHRHHWWAGVALGLGVLTKVSPIFLVPLAALIVADPLRNGRLVRVRVRDLSLFGAGLAVSCVVVLAPVAASGDLAGAVHGTFSRTETSVSVGGLSLFGLSSFQAFAWLPGWVAAHDAAVRVVTTAVPALGAVLVAPLALRWARRDRAYGLLGGSLLVFALLLLTQPLTQPQYLLWVLPEIIGLVVVWGAPRWQVVLLSVTPLVFEYSLLGPLAFLAPLATSTGVISASAVATSSFAWLQQPTNLWGVDRGGDFRSLAAVATCFALIELMVAVIQRAPKRPHTTLQRVSGSLTRSPLAVVLAGGALLLATVGSLAAYRPAPLPRTTASMSIRSATARGATLDVRLDLRPGAGQTVARLLAFPVVRLKPDRPVDVFVDPGYPGPDSSLRSVQGVFDHVAADLRVRGDRRRVSAVNAPALVRLLRNTAAASSSIVVMTAGVMPTEIFSRRADLLTPWLHAGGTLVWSGAPIGYYSEAAVGQFDGSSPDSLRSEGPARLVGPGVIETGQTANRLANEQSETARALGLGFNSTAFGVLQAGIKDRGGQVLGFTGQGLSSISALPVGSGSVTIFAGDTYDEELISHDLTMLLISHVNERSGGIVAQNVRARRGPVQWSARLQVPRDASVVVEAFDPSIEGVAFVRRSARVNVA